MTQQFQRARPQPARRRWKEERQPEDYAGDESQPTLEQYAGGVARQLIKQAGLEDNTAIWRAIKRAYLTGYSDGQR